MKSNKKIKAYLLRLLTKKKNLSFDLKKSKRVLILKYDRIGDMVVTTPIFRELKTAYPDISISVLASEENKDVIRYNPYIDKIYTNYKNSILKDLPTLLKLRKKSFVSSMGDKIKIGINIEGSFPEKSIQKKELEEICSGLYSYCRDIVVVILASPNKISNKKKMVSELGLDFVIPSYTTETIIDAAALIEQLDLIITPDTSIVHIASSFDKPVVSIHENNKDSFRLWSPSSTLSKTIFAKSRYGLFDYSVNDIVKSAADIIKNRELDI